MEDATLLDLNRAIQQWRRNLAQSPAFRSENLAELESHLRDSIGALQARGLSAEESFLIAVRRMGGGAPLETEFGKVNGSAIWLDRLLWTLIGYQVWIFISGIISLVSGNALFFGFNVTGYDFKTHGRAIPSILFTLVHLAGFAGSLALCWWVLCRKGRRFGPWLRRMLCRRSTVALLFGALCLLSLSVRLGTGGMGFLQARFCDPAELGEYQISQCISSAILQVVTPAVFVGLTLMLARKRLRLAGASNLHAGGRP